MGNVYYAGLDLSKNHFGLTIINTAEEEFNVYSYTSIANMTKKQVKEYDDRPFEIIIPDAFSNHPNYIRTEIRVNPRLNKLEMDAVKSKAINLAIIWLFKMWGKMDLEEDELFLSLEDYIVMNNGIVSLVHTTEDFKYRFFSDSSNDIYPMNRTLFLCCNSTWKKLMGKEASSKPTGKDRYENIKNCIKHNYPTFQECLDKLDEIKASEDIKKDVIDSWGLANAGTKKDSPLFKSYTKRIFKYLKGNTNYGTTGVYRNLSK